MWLWREFYGLDVEKYMSIDFSANYFELFDLPVAFDIDLNELSSRYRVLQSEVHPDRYANASAQERRLSVQSAGLVNEAFQTLKDPLNRGFYLLDLAGVQRPDDHKTTSDLDFLMQQMAYRERLDEVAEQDEPFDAADQLRDDLEAETQQLIQKFKDDYVKAAYPAAQDELIKLQFFRRLLSQLDELESRLEDQLS